MQSLALYEELMLLALCEEKGTIQSAYIGYAVAAGVLAELKLQQRIKLESGRRKHVKVIDNSPVDDPVLAECMQIIRHAKRPKVLRSWVNHLAFIKDLNHKVAKNLAAHGVVDATEDKVLWLFTRRVYPEINPEPEQALRQRLRQLVMNPEAVVDARTVVLLALCQGAQLLPQVFTRKELREHKPRIKQLVKGNQLGDATREVIEAVQIAVMVAVMIPTITTVTST
ncbi:GOLPH3/VPS74 family protein [Aliidiomarina maris]|uniref:Golgi phosphoprotein 3 GPP34 n=1 Tax=Aliidiomarina maris TaxID=531312 RepID=A0A327X6N5_9GAMM|nr:GPP34 family phosphoprotein [Aliidiomarina maris]MBA3988770.1 hypothetical protein [Idiomarina sp.]RAK01694.1 Golgi phosphoprotein 3 GPP34 [Aliidiomarina maris]RUO28516.1 hypothetical protein CWE07_01530 [Aliidiomarina maris]